MALDFDGRALLIENDDDYLVAQTLAYVSQSQTDRARSVRDRHPDAAERSSPSLRSLAAPHAYDAIAPRPEPSVW